MPSSNATDTRLHTVFVAIHHFLCDPATPIDRFRTRFFFSLAVGFALYYGCLAMAKGFSGDYIIQDDARQHIFWMQRFSDSDLFPQDLIADYYQSVSPAGFTALYQWMNAWSIPPEVFNKLLPTLLSVVTAGYAFGVCFSILPVPAGAWMGSLLLSQNLWMQDTLISGKAASFLHPLLMAFLYYFVRQKTVGILLVLGLLGLFYPTFLFVCSGILILQIITWRKGRLGLTHEKGDYWRCLLGLAVAFVMLLPYALKASEFAPVISGAQARLLPEFQAGARASFFHDHDPWRFWFNASRSGIRLPSSFVPQLSYAALVLPLLLALPNYFPLTHWIGDRLKILGQLALAGFTVFFLAHAVIFKLHVPSRYTQHTLRFVVAIAAGTALIVLLDALFRWAKRFPWRQSIVLGLSVLLAIALCGQSWFSTDFPFTGYLTGKYPELYQFFAAQPKDSVIASLDTEVNNLPSFAGRSILVGGEYAIPYHWGYYQHIRQRALDLIQAQYTTNPTELANFIQTYGIDFWLLNQGAFKPNYLDNRWLRQYQPANDQAVRSLEMGVTPWLAQKIGACQVFQAEALVVLEGSCLVRESSITSSKR